MKTAYSYLRISSEKQTQGGGIERQMQASRAYALQHGYKLVDTLQDIGVSAYKGKNSTEGALGAFIDAINSGSVEVGSVLIVESLDRLSRQDPMAAFTQFSQIISKGVTIVTLVDGQIYSPDSVKEDVSKLFISLGSMMRAHDESKVKSSRQIAAWNRKRGNGKVMTARCPAWLEVVDGEFKVKEGAQEIIDYIFDSSLDGMGAYVICRHMNRNIDKFPSFTGGKTWNKNYILKILSSGHVIGELQAHTSVSGKREPTGEPIKNYFPAVVSEEKFRAVQASLAQRQKTGAGRKGKNYTNIFSGILKCGRCGGAWTYRPQTAGRGHDMIRCSFAHQGKDCDAPGWRYHDFEREFIKFVKELDFTEIFGGEGASKKIKEMKSKALLEAGKIQTIQRQINVIFDRMTSLDLSETMMTGMVAKEKELQEQLREATATKEELEHEAMRLSSLESVKVKGEFEELYGKISDGDHELRSKVAGILKRVVRRIDLYSYKKMKGEDHQPERHTNVTFVNGEQRVILEGGSMKTMTAASVDLKRKFEGKI